MPLIEFHATNLPRAFILNGLASALVIVLALYIKGRFDKFKDKDGSAVKQETNFKSLSFTFVVTFFAAMGAYAVLYYTFGFGGGMLSTN